MNRSTRLWPFAPRTWAAFAFAISIAMLAVAGDTVYTYDALGRLTSVTRPDGATTVYTLDAAGNRTNVQETASPAPAMPASVTAPASNSTGNFTVNWGASPLGTVTAYELYESTNPAFTSQSQSYSGLNLSKLVSGKGTGTYFYRSRACGSGGCSDDRNANNAVAVTLPPAAPTGLNYWQNSQCSWYAEWTASAGANGYRVRDKSGNFEFPVSITNATISVCGAPGYTGNPNDYKPKWVKACNGTLCGTQANFAP